MKKDMFLLKKPIIYKFRRITGLVFLFIILTFSTKEIFSQVNVSDGRTCTASSTNSGYPASYLVNNLTGSGLGWMASSAASSSWVYVDLSTNYSIDRVDIYTQHCNNNTIYLTGWYIQTSTDASTWTTRWSTTTNTTNGWTTCSFTVVTARYVRITECHYNSNDGTLNRTVDEIDVYMPACTTPSTPTISVSNIQTTSATLNFSSSSGSPTITYDWYLYYYNNDVETLATSGSTTSTSVNVTGLTPSRKYHFRVRAYTSCNSTYSSYSSYSYFRTCSVVTTPVLPNISPGTVSGITYNGYITDGKEGCTFFAQNPTSGTPDLADIGMAGSNGTSLSYNDYFGTNHTGSGLTYNYTVGNVQCGTWYCLDLGTNPLASASPAIGVSMDNSASTPFITEPLAYASGNGTATLVFTNPSSRTMCLNSSGVETYYYPNVEVRITVTGAGGDGVWHNTGSQYYFEVPASGTFSVNVLALADAYDWNGHMTGSNYQQQGCPYQNCPQIAASIGTQPTLYGIGYWFNSMHSLNYNYTSSTAWGKVHYAYNPKWIVNAAVTAGSIGTNHSVCPGVTPNLLTSASNGTGVGTISYEWQSSPNGSTWTTISGATGATYQPAVITATTYYRRRTKSVAAATCSSAYTNTVTVTVSTLSTAPTSITVTSP